MIEDLGSYSLDRFIPFLPESYFRLFERINAAFWPAHLALLALGIAAAVFAFRGQTRAVAWTLAPAFGVAAIAFHFRLYAELTPVGTVFGWAFLLQAALLVAWGALGNAGRPLRGKPAMAIALTLIAGGIGLYPLLPFVSSRAWTEAEAYGLAPNPTVFAAFGVLLLAARPRWLALLLPIPLIWSAVSTATLHTLAAPYPFLISVGGLAAIVGLVLNAGGRTRPGAGLSV